MLLNKIVIKSTDEVIREVSFKKGLNLIIDESVTVQTESGNSVGKTTLLRAVDFCFGSEGEDIYTDEEFKTRNEAVFTFLEEKRIVFELHGELDNKPITLTRGFGKNGLMKINSELLPSISDYRVKLEKLLFNIEDSKPSLRQVMPKFIRKNHDLMSRTLKFLHQTTTNGQYEILHFFLFGFREQELLSERSIVRKQKKTIHERISALKGSKSLSALKQGLKIIEGEIEKSRESVKKFEVADAYKKELESLNLLKQEIGEIRTEVSSNKLKLSLNNATLAELRENRSKIDPSTIRELYEEAKTFLPKIQKTFEEVLDFHNRMIANKIDFIQAGIGKIEKELQSKEHKLAGLLDQEANILRLLSNTDSFGNVELLFRESNALYERRGAEKRLIDDIERLSEEERQLGATEEDYNDKIKSYLEDFHNNIDIFNEPFTEYSKQLYGESYFLDPGEHYNDFKIENVGGNVGGGKKKGQVAAFDLAYTTFLNKTNSKFPKFVMHDSIEDIHSNQIKTLFDIMKKRCQVPFFGRPLGLIVDPNPNLLTTSVSQALLP